MTLQYFNTLPQRQQHKKLLSKGIYLADHKTDSTEALLFKLNNFFVEVCFPCEGDEVLYTRHFEDASKLEPYWQHASAARSVA
jgi:hypothetical protein